MFVDFDWGAALVQSPILGVLILCSVLTLGFAIERSMYYHRRGGDTGAVVRRAMGAVQRGRLDEAVEHLQELKHPLGEVAIGTLAGFSRAPQEAEEIMHVMLNQQKLLLERNTGLLGTMAAVTPLIGLLGTVWGIMRAFQAMSKAATAGPSIVAAGVAEALVTTAAGLVVAVPAVILYNYLNRRQTTMLAEAENHTRMLCVAARSAVAQVEAQEAAAGSGAVHAVRRSASQARVTVPV
jgi:biopolymer transport protein ExbB